jgi:hypothetical protein
MTAVNETSKAAHTPRYVEGVCFGEYDTNTKEFSAETNPMMLPKGSIITQDDQFDKDGNIVTHTSGLVEDKGSDIARKPLVSLNLKRTGGVATNKTPKLLNKSGQPFDVSKLFG